jgi:polyisoprenoid-binding protein YceI
MRTIIFSTALTAIAAGAALAFTPPTTDLGNTPSGQYSLDKNHANILFGVSHLGFSTYYSRFNDFDATLDFNPKNPEQSRLNVTIKTASADANNPKMETKYDGAKFFQTARYPVATFTSSGIKQLSNNTGTVTGDLTLLGVTKPVTLNVTFNGAGMNPFAGVHTLGFSATGSFKRSDFGMTEYLPAVGDDVQLMIQAEFNHQASKKAPK